MDCKELTVQEWTAENGMQEMDCPRVGSRETIKGKQNMDIQKKKNETLDK